LDGRRQAAIHRASWASWIRHAIPTQESLTTINLISIPIISYLLGFRRAPKIQLQMAYDMELMGISFVISSHFAAWACRRCKRDEELHITESKLSGVSVRQPSFPHRLYSWPDTNRAMTHLERSPLRKVTLPLSGSYLGRTEFIFDQWVFEIAGSEV